MRKQEQDYPTRAEFAAAFNWWEISKATFVFTGLRGVTLPEHYGPFKRLLVRAGCPFKPDGKPSGTHLWAIPLGLATIVPAGVACGRFLGIWAAMPGAVVGGIPLLAISITAQVMWFRAGGWEQVLKKRDQKSVGPRRQEEMS